MKKPTVGETDKLRALTEDPELRALMEQYYAASAGEREPILEAFAAKADELHPDWRETVERAERDGVILRALFIHALKEARARPDLTERDQFEIMDAGGGVCHALRDIFRHCPLSAAARGAIRLVSVVQKMEMIARLGLEEAEKRKRRAMSDGGRKGGKKSGEAREGKQALGPPRDRAQASYLFSAPWASDGDVALEIKTRWKLETPLPLPCGRSRSSCPNFASRELFRSERSEGGFASETKGASVSERRASLSTYRCASRRKDARLVFSMFYRPVPARTT